MEVGRKPRDLQEEGDAPKHHDPPVAAVDVLRAAEAAVIAGAGHQAADITARAVIPRMSR